MLKNIPKYLKSLEEIKYVINPQFYTCKYKNDELVLLETGESRSITIENSIFETKTQLEALENHVHLFDNVKRNHQLLVKKISIQLADNLLSALKNKFT